MVNYLLDRRIKTIDYILISHFDSDHSNGLIDVIQKLDVKNILISKQAYYSEEYKNIVQIINKRKINTKFVQQGDILKIDKNVEIKIMYPPEELEYEDLNNNSVVAKLKYINFSILFTGDIEQIAEEKLVSIYGDFLKSDILKVAHHGSNTSSMDKFLKLVNPKIALIGVGKNNSFGHPSIYTIKKLEELSANIYRTDENGEIDIILENKNELKINKLIE